MKKSFMAIVLLMITMVVSACTPTTVVNQAPNAVVLVDVPNCPMGTQKAEKKPDGTWACYVIVTSGSSVPSAMPSASASPTPSASPSSTCA